MVAGKSIIYMTVDRCQVDKVVVVHGVASVVWYVIISGMGMLLYVPQFTRVMHLLSFQGQT